MSERHSDRPDTPDTEPAPAITSKARSDRWVLDRRTNSKAARGAMAPTVSVEVDRPAPTLAGAKKWVLVRWEQERPATTVQGTGRGAKPGHRDRAGGEQQFEDSIPITLEEAATLQSFPADYAFKGSKTARFTQVGNAIPPLLARSILTAITSPKGGS